MCYISPELLAPKVFILQQHMCRRTTTQNEVSRRNNTNSLASTISGESSEFLWEENLCNQGVGMSSHLLNYVNCVTFDIKLHVGRTQQRNNNVKR